jgi:hypothetical protein
MKFKDGLSVQDIEIERFIFHIVHQDEDQPILLDETPLGSHKTFFAERILDTIEGNRFVFNDGSFIHDRLREIDSNEKVFVKKSKEIAIHFHSFQMDSIKPGVVILMKIRIDGKPYFSIIKYDHEEVIAYTLDKISSKAILEDVANSFTKNKDSLHKSALISLEKKDGEVLVIDKKVRDDISKFFKNFLNIKRKYTNEEMTNTISQITLDVVKDNSEDLPKDFCSSIRRKIFDATQSEDSFSLDGYYEKVFGLVGNEKIRKSLERHLKKHDLDGEVFKFDKKALSKPRKIKIRTKEGVRIQYEDSVSDRVVFSDEGNSQKITITTERYYEE